MTLPRLHPAQRQIKSEARRFNTVACGRRFGKSTLTVDLMVGATLPGYPVGYFCPTYKLLTEVLNDTVKALAPITRRVDRQQKRIEIITGGVVEMWSLDNKDAGRSRKYKRAIVDEAGLVGHLATAWEENIRPTLADYQGDAWLLGTPKGMNFFRDAFLRGTDPLQPDWMSWQMPTAANPFIRPEEIESARREMTDRRFRQEYLAEFLEDAGGVFRGVSGCVDPSPLPAGPERGATYIGAIDWGRTDDFTVLGIMDVGRRRLVALDRFNQIGWELQRGRVEALHRIWQPVVWLAESNSIGEPNIEQLQREGIPVNGFCTTNETKATVIEGLSLMFETRGIIIPKDETLIGELTAFEQSKLPSGRLRYSAPEGLHDDCVMMLALANHACDNSIVRYHEGIYR